MAPGENEFDTPVIDTESKLVCKVVIFYSCLYFNINDIDFRLLEGFSPNF